MTQPKVLNIAAIATFVVLAFGWSWTLWLFNWWLKPDTLGVGSALTIISGFGPSLAGVVTIFIYEGGTGLRNWLARCLNWRLNPAWYLLVFFGPALAIIAAVGIELVLGGTLGSSSAAGHMGAALQQGMLILAIGGPLGEEFGWRGYAQPALSARLGWRWAGLIVGLLWGLWHLPLFFIPGTGQAQMPIALFMASSVAFSIILARIAENTSGSILPAILFHWSINFWPGFIPIIPNNGSVRPYVLVMAVLFVVAMIVLVKPGPRKTASVQ